MSRGKTGEVKIVLKPPRVWFALEEEIRRAEFEGVQQYGPFNPFVSLRYDDYQKVLRVAEKIARILGKTRECCCNSFDQEYFKSLALTILCEERVLTLPLSKSFLKRRMKEVYNELCKELEGGIMKTVPEGTNGKPVGEENLFALSPRGFEESLFGTDPQPRHLRSLERNF